MYDLSDFRKGLKILFENDPFVVVDFQHVKPGKGNQFTRTKMRNMLTGQNREMTFKQGEKFGVPDVVFRDMTFLYKDDTGYTFMDQEDFTQVTMMPDEVGEQINYLTENLKVQVVFFNDKPITIDVPRTVILKVTETDPGVKGDRVTGGTKPATLETGLVVHVPLHIAIGDTLKVDTDSGEYVERVNMK